MNKNARSKLIKAISNETDERVIADTLEYVKVLIAYRKYIGRIAEAPPSPEAWKRMPRWKQINICLICGYYSLQYWVPKLIKSVIGKAFSHGKKDCA